MVRLHFQHVLLTLVCLAGPADWLADAGALPTTATDGIHLTSPRGGESWAVGSKHYVTWKGKLSPRSRTVKIDYSVDGGKSWETIVDAARNSGRYLWPIPNCLSTAIKLRITERQSGQTVECTSSFSIIPSQAVRAYEWLNVTDKAAFAPRDGAGALVFKDRMWLLGGWNPSDKRSFPRICNNEVWSARTGADWRLEKANTFLDRTFDATKDWEGRHTAGYVVFKDRMWIVGGDVNQRHYHFDVWSSADGKTWSLTNKGKPVPWGPRALHHTLAFQDKIWVMGGQTIPNLAPADEVFYRDIWTTSDGIKWEKVTPREPFWSARGMIGGSAVFKKRIWILGGGTYDTPKMPARNFYSDVWSTGDGVSWQRHVELAPWKPRQYHDVAVFDGRMWVMEGYANANRNDVWYSADGVNWYEVPNTPWAPRHAASVFVHDGMLWMVAGNNMKSDVWRLRRKATSKRLGRP